MHKTGEEVSFGEVPERPVDMKNKQIQIELIGIILTAVAVFFISGQYDVFEAVLEFLQAHEEYELDEIIMVFVFLVFGMAFFSFQRWQEQKELNRSLEQKNRELKDAARKIKQLQKMIPICASCKKIRDEDGWQDFESYISKKTDTTFSHSICPDCSEKLYSNETWYGKIDSDKDND